MLWYQLLEVQYVETDERSDSTPRSSCMQKPVTRNEAKEGKSKNSDFTEKVRAKILSELMKDKYKVRPYKGEQTLKPKS